MLSRPCWAIGAIGFPHPSLEQLVVRTLAIGPRWDQPPSAVSLALYELLSDTVSGKDSSSTLHPFGCRQDPARENAGSRDAKSLH